VADETTPTPDPWDGWTIEGPQGYTHHGDGVAHGYGPLRQFAGPGKKIAEVVYRPKAPGGPSFAVASRNGAPTWGLTIDAAAKIVRVVRK
jgi:hypothetical protein